MSFQKKPNPYIMKNLTFLSLFVFSASCFAQDTTKKDIIKKCKFNHEVGINTTLLLKQIFNLSNNTFPTLPYDLTYKLIRDNNKWAIRVGIGVTMNNSSVSSTTTSTNQISGGPDPIVPTTTNSTNLFYRVGWERRYAFDSRIVAFGGFDFAGQYGTTTSQSSNVFNNLPNSYSYTKTHDNTTTMMYGGGPVAGIQFFITKRLSLFTEIPIYFQYTSQKEVTDNYQNQLVSSSGTDYISSDNSQTQITKGSKLSVTLPVTIYLALKF
jgi:hypothetical protein